MPVYPMISGTKTARAVLNNLARNPYAAALCIDREDGGTGAAHNVSMDKIDHPRSKCRETINMASFFIDKAAPSKTT